MMPQIACVEDGEAMAAQSVQRNRFATAMLHELHKLQ
jgi:hypothetical protein